MVERRAASTVKVRLERVSKRVCETWAWADLHVYERYDGRSIAKVVRKQKY